MTPDHDTTRTQPPAPAEPTGTFDPALDGALAAAFGPDPTPGGWSHPPLLRDEPSDHSPLTHPSSAEMPRADGRYQLLGEIARGGMGVVLKGRDPDLGRDLAFKVLRSELAHRPGAVQRFVEEAQVGGQLQHPGIVPVYDLGRFADGRPYFAMKLVKGRTLADLLADRPDPTADRGAFVRHFLQVCQTVAYAHSRGVIHRDLKPANVMVGAFDEVLVMDWGLAKVLPRGGLADEHKASRERPRPEDGTEIRTARFGSGSETAAGSVMGTPAFMPPEQAGGEVEKLDERADVFGLGAILCVILTGQPPYRADTSEAVRLMAVRGQLAEARARLDGCGADAELIALCKRCLTADRDARPRHAGEVSAALSAHLAGVEERARAAELARASAQAEAREQRKRRRVQVLLTAAVGVLIAVGGSFGWYADRTASDQRAERERVAREQAEGELRSQLEWEQRESVERSRREHTAEAVAGLLNQAEVALRAGDAAKGAVALDAAESRAKEGGAEGLADRLAGLRADLVVLRGLDAVDRFRWTSEENVFPDFAKVLARYREVLGRFGADPDAVSVEAVGPRITGSTVRDRLVSALDRMLRAGGSTRVRDALRLIDANPFRDAVRDAELAHDVGRMSELAGRPVALDQPPWFAAFVGGSPAVPVKRRRMLLEAAVQQRPGELGLLMALGNTYPINGAEGADERVRWFQAAVAVAPNNAAGHSSLGFALHDKKDHEGAIAALKEAIRLEPNFSPAHSNLGIALHAKKDYDGAVAAYKEAIRLDPNDAPAHHGLGNVLHDKKDYDGAIAAYKQAIRLDPNYAAAHNNLGNALRGKRDYDGAIAACREAIRIDPECAGAHNNLGNALRDKKDYDGAIAACREAIRIDPTFAMAHSNLGIALHEKQDYDGAIAAYKQAIRLDPNCAPAHSNLGAALHDTKDYDGAIAAYKQAIRLDPKDAAAQYNLGNALRDKKDYDGAIAACKEAIRIDPTFAPAHSSLGLTLFAKTDYDGAVAAYKRAIRLDPNDAKSHSNLGLALSAKTDYDGAIAEYKQAIRLDPNDAKAHSNLGLALSAKTDYDGAIAEYKQAIRLDPKIAPAHYNLGNALYLRQEHDGAVAAYKEAIRLDPKDAKAHFCLGNVLREQKDYDGAIAAGREAIRLDPGAPIPHCFVGMLLLQRGRSLEAAPLLRRGHELGSKQPGWSLPSAQWLMQCEAQLRREGLIAPMPHPVNR